MGSVFLDRYNGDTCTKIYSADDLSRLVKDSVEYYIGQAERANQKACKTKEEVRAETINEYAAENERLKAKLRRSIVILDSDVELERYERFCRDHAKCREGTKVDGGKVPYVKRFGTGFGFCTTVYCQVCGANEDITDPNVW